MAVAVAGVILSIGSKFGPGGLASLQAGIQMLGQLAGSIKSSMDEAWKFGVLMKNLEVDITEASIATKGLIDTTEMMRGAMKFNAAQMKLSSTQLRDIAVLAENMADKLGTDATDEFNKLTDAITKGQSRALKQYGIELKDTENLLDAQAEALQKVTALGAGMTTEFDHLGDRLYAADNALTTLKNTILSSGEDVQWLNELIEGFTADVNDAVAAVGKHGLNGALENVFFTIRTGIRETQTDLVEWLGVLNESTIASARMMNYIMLQAQAVKASGAKPTTREGESVDWTPSLGAVDPALFTAPGGKKPRKGGGGGGGGGAKAAPDLASMTGEQRLAVFAKEAEAQRTLAGIEAERAAFMEVYNAAFAGIADTSAAYTESEVETWEAERAAEERELAYLERRGAYMAQYAEAEEVTWERERMADEEEAAREERKIAYLDQYREKHKTALGDMLFGDIEYKARSEAMWKSSMSAKLQMVGMLVSGWSGLMDKENKKQFKAWQALAIVEATIAGLVGSIETYKALCGMGPAGPIIGAIAAASVIAQTIVTVAKIKKQKYNSGGGGGADTGGGFKISSPSAGAGSAPESTQGNQKLEITNIVNLDGEKVYESVKTHNDSALRAGRGGAFEKVA